MAGEEPEQEKLEAQMAAATEAGPTHEISAINAQGVVSEEGEKIGQLHEL